MKQRGKKVRELNGYKLIYCPEHPKAMSSNNWKGYVYEHIVLAEQQLGRKLSSNEVVHHLDFNRSNNKQQNLLILDRGQHTKLHAWLNKGALKLNQPNKFQTKVSSLQSSCKICGVSLQKKQKFYCGRICYDVDRKKVAWPDAQQLALEIKTSSWLALGRKYGVSGNAVKKWARKYKLI